MSADIINIERGPEVDLPRSDRPESEKPQPGREINVPARAPEIERPGHGQPEIVPVPRDPDSPAPVVPDQAPDDMPERPANTPVEMPLPGSGGGGHEVPAGQ